MRKEGVDDRGLNGSICAKKRGEICGIRKLLEAFNGGRAAALVLDREKRFGGLEKKGKRRKE